MPRPIQALIHTDALQNNVGVLRQLVPHAKLFAAIKANAYGHGIERVLPALTQGHHRVDGLALLDLEEALRVRQLGWTGPILLLEGIFEPADLAVCTEWNLWSVVHCKAQVDAILKTPHPTHPTPLFFVKLNTGMNRLGFSPQAYHQAVQDLASRYPVVHMTHFSDADTPKGIEAAWQQFNHVVDKTAILGGRSLCNSAALLRYSPHPSNSNSNSNSDNSNNLNNLDYLNLQGDWVRPGIAVYGSSPLYPQHPASEWGLQGAMTLKTHLIGIQSLQAGDTVGYGSTYQATHSTWVGIAACGYADGYPRHAPTGTPILVQGERTRLLGRVSMDMLAVDLSPWQSRCTDPHTLLGAEVTLWGQGPHQTYLDVDEVAQSAQTIAYELMCGLALRVPVKVI